MSVYNSFLKEHRQVSNLDNHQTGTGFHSRAFRSVTSNPFPCFIKGEYRSILVYSPRAPCTTSDEKHDAGSLAYAAAVVAVDDYVAIVADVVVDSAGSATSAHAEAIACSRNAADEGVDGGGGKDIDSRSRDSEDVDAVGPDGVGPDDVDSGEFRDD